MEGVWPRRRGGSSSSRATGRGRGGRGQSPRSRRQPRRRRPGRRHPRRGRPRRGQPGRGQPKQCRSGRLTRLNRRLLRPGAYPPGGVPPRPPPAAGATPAGAGRAGTAGTEPAEETGDGDAEEVRRDVRPLAVVGIILGIIALVGVAAGVLVVVTHGFRPRTVVTVTYRPAAVFGLRPGQCVTTGSNALQPTVVSCARPHDAEVFAVFPLPAAPWPGASAVRADADNGCASRLGSYIDPQLATAGLAQEFVYPNQDAWQANQRTVVCEVSATEGRLTGSVRANG